MPFPELEIERDTVTASALAEIVVISDFWSPIAEVRKTLAQLSATGAHGHTVQVVDPAEETFPYSGRVEFFERLPDERFRE